MQYSKECKVNEYKDSPAFARLVEIRNWIDNSWSNTLVICDERFNSFGTLVYSCVYHTKDTIYSRVKIVVFFCECLDVTITISKYENAIKLIYQTKQNLSLLIMCPNTELRRIEGLVPGLDLLLHTLLNVSIEHEQTSNIRKALETKDQIKTDL